MKGTTLANACKILTKSFSLAMRKHVPLATLALMLGAVTYAQAGEKTSTVAILPLRNGTQVADSARLQAYMQQLRGPYTDIMLGRHLENMSTIKNHLLPALANRGFHFVFNFSSPSQSANNIESLENTFTWVVNNHRSYKEVIGMSLDDFLAPRNKRTVASEEFIDFAYTKLVKYDLLQPDVRGNPEPKGARKFRFMTTVYCQKDDGFDSEARTLGDRIDDNPKLGAMITDVVVYNQGERDGDGIGTWTDYGDVRSNEVSDVEKVQRCVNFLNKFFTSRKMPVAVRVGVYASGPDYQFSSGKLRNSTELAARKKNIHLAKKITGSKGTNFFSAPLERYAGVPLNDSPKARVDLELESDVLAAMRE